MEPGLGEDDDPLTFLRDSPQFAQLCQLVRSQPDMLPQVLTQIAASNPELMQVIRENQVQYFQVSSLCINVLSLGSICADVE